MNSPASHLFAAQSAEAAQFLRALAHEGRLRVLCYLAGEGEISAGDLTRRVGLSQSALSQHLAKLREVGLLAVRKEAQSVFYRIADPRVEQMLEALQLIFCPDVVSARSGREV